MKKLLQSSFKKSNKKVIRAGILIDGSSELRQVEFFKGLYHGRKNHFFGNSTKRQSLKVLDPEGNPDKWMQYIVKLAQEGNGKIKKISTGQMMEIMGSMPKSKTNEMLRVGVRLFKRDDSSNWVLNTILTKQT